jgi:N-carbamoyl-L-amino-acid hydrolase
MVLSGLEAVATMIEAKQRPRRAIEIVAWTNEEASRFAPGMSGSEVFTGGTPIETIRALTDSDGISFGTALDVILAGDREVPLRAIERPYYAFIELHIEQGPELERMGIPVGIVTGMQGTRRYRVTVEGEAAHAGTALRSERQDALMAAARMICAMDQAAVEPADTKLTVGRLDVSPNAPPVVPERAFFSVDIRHPENSVIDNLDIKIHAIVEGEAGP